MITARLTTEELDRFLGIASFVDDKLPKPKKPLCFWEESDARLYTTQLK